MYLQLTTKCQMKCDHCAFAATNKGTAMSRDTFMHAIQLASRYGEYITLGGGEPTMNKDFFPMLDKAIELHHAGMIEGDIMIITNGKATRKAMKLLDYVDDDAPISVELSQDEWHDPIDPKVVQRFRWHQRARDSYRGGYGYSSENYPRAGIRTVTQIIPVGRAVTTGVANSKQKCACDDVVCDPEGKLWSCGCKHTQIGWAWQQDALDGYDREYAHEGGVEPCDDSESDRPGYEQEIRA